MTRTALVVTGTDTGIGKTMVSALLTLGLDGFYWKPIQSGTVDGTDTATVAALTGLPPDRFVPERYRLGPPLSPHRAAALDGVTIETGPLAALPATHPPNRPLIIEGAGGLMVPINRQVLMIDLFALWRLPVVICARTSLGTINHSLLSVEALRHRRIPIQGIVFVGDAMPDTEQTIIQFTGVKYLGRLPWLEAPGPAALAETFASRFQPADFLEPVP